ncbi:M20 family metallo-hydrolase [Nonomuraea sp. MG754425]|uniref:M20 family metallo-hydrolase n=1 Tax=Nonomuraea sp. MG754425 TaxID=2570319 RepID=UPI001F48330B|nr:M20 family metallo-hydrolase [Nonomuraea sp. MG754425]MCF6467967.1 M20 family metallo-hydrolase [Nonomuraea sp. MG754425]
MGSGGEPDIDGERLLRRLRELSAFGRTAEGGITRPGFSEAGRQADAFLIDQARRANLHAEVDAAGNVLFGRAAIDRTRPALLLGSHLDTVVNGGWLDGAYGVVSALEVVQVLAERHIDLDCDVVAIAFANEEGALFPQAFWGSMVAAGLLGSLPGPPADHEGRPLAPALALAGGDLDALPSAVWPPPSVRGYLELHIEQGPILDAGPERIGIVDAITGRAVLAVDLIGEAAHAGTTPLNARADALLGAAHLVIATRELAAQGLCHVASVGHLQVEPNSANTLAGHARLLVDLRDADAARLTKAEDTVRDQAGSIAARLGLGVRCRRMVRSEPAAMDAGIRRHIAGSAAALGLAARVMSSGAGHDAQIMAGITPTGMIFVPSIGGVSHVPQEDTAPADLLAGARVLLGATLRLLACPDRRNGYRP